MNKQCTFCLSDNIEERHAVTAFTYRERDMTLTYDEYYTHCNHCGEEYVTLEQARRSDKSADYARRQADGLLTPDEIKALRKAFALTQAQAAQIFGGGKNAFAKYERGEVRQSVAMDKLLRVVQKHPELIHELSAN